ncbi:MAG: adenosine kinase, partial [Ignavibacteriae bacterium]
MKRIALTGIGNALVDIEYRVTEEELLAFGVQKGAMTLTEASRQAELIASLSDRDAHRSSGGSAANTVIAFAQFGGTAAFKSLLGRDDFGTVYAGEFTDLGIELDAELVDGEPTGTCLVMIT